MPPLYSIGKVTVAPALMLGWRPKVEGLENVPSTGGVILAANHLSVADEYFLGAVLPRHVAFWAKAEYFTGTGVRGFLTRSLVTGLGAIRVERGGGRAALSAFDGAIPLLRAGRQVAVFPEGTRSPDGRLYRGRTGAARLALAAGVPIVPVGFLGTDEIQPIGALWPKFKRGTVVVRFGKPLDFTGRADDHTELRKMTDEMMSEIQRLTGQEYVGRYAPPRTGAGRAVNGSTGDAPPPAGPAGDDPVTPG
ncbi:lysophospholipid acyltransferase family protein [Solwaraspora sp. WMMD406]|uniref:lysophospholipid acyltransferase family protein n=1 Tax=Solwaraspora sp. WMMD406 TaxID=3016095 RepID=UPI002416A1B4|nr:lysophospholipid acyltransferase family protein [Solwaraspora sp. WMMD406]MDG4764805.1 lysophospholipid acyltransferase family protein [Solwaraspora sp. WMMD406]